MSDSLSPSERTLRARLGAHILHSRHSGQKITAAARAASPGSDTYWLNQVDADAPGLPDDERHRRAAHLKKAHFIRLAYRSARSRRGAE